MLQEIPDCPQRQEQFGGMLERTLHKIGLYINADIIERKKCECKVRFGERDFDPSLALSVIKFIESKGYQCDYEEDGSYSSGHYFNVTVPSEDPELISFGKYRVLHRGRTNIRYFRNLKEAKRKLNDDCKIEEVSKPVLKPQPPSKFKSLLTKIRLWYTQSEQLPVHTIPAPEIPKEIYDKIDIEIKKNAKTP
jgi:hypothetical protein